MPETHRATEEDVLPGHQQSGWRTEAHSLNGKVEDNGERKFAECASRQGHAGLHAFCQLTQLTTPSSYFQGVNKKSIIALIPILT